MLTLTRKEGEVIILGDPKNPMGTITVHSIKGDRARLSFDFPTSIAIHRKEIADVIERTGTRELPTVTITGNAQANGKAKSKDSVPSSTHQQ